MFADLLVVKENMGILLRIDVRTVQWDVKLAIPPQYVQRVIVHIKLIQEQIYAHVLQVLCYLMELVIPTQIRVKERNICLVQPECVPIIVEMDFT